MDWNSKPPESRGIYWLREPGKEAMIVEVVTAGDGRHFVAVGLDATLVELSTIDPAAEWAGPVTTPN